MRSFDEWFDENCDGSDLAKDACRKLWDEFSDQINIICRKSYEKQQSKVDELKLQVAEMKSRLNDAYTAGQSAMYAARQSKVDELQKQVDDLELTIKGTVTFVDLQIEATEQGREAAIGTQAKNWWSSKLLMLRLIRRVLEQALKGGE